MVQSTTFTTSGSTPVTPIPEQNNVLLFGVPDSSWTFNPDTILDGRSIEAFQTTANNVAGTSGDVFDALTALFNHGANPHVYFIPLNDSANSAAAEAQIDKWERISAPNGIALATVAGNLTGASNTSRTVNLSQWAVQTTPVKNTLITRLETQAEKHYSRVIAGTMQTTYANDRLWARTSGGTAVNALARVLGVSNRVNGTENPAPHVINAIEVLQAEYGRGRGLSGARIYGATTLDHDTARGDTDIATNNTNYLATLANSRRGHIVLGGQFNEGSTNKERFIDVALRVDLIKRNAIQYIEDELYSTNYRAVRYTNELTQHASGLVTPENGIHAITFANARRTSEDPPTITIGLTIDLSTAIDRFIIQTTIQTTADVG